MMNSNIYKIICCFLLAFLTSCKPKVYVNEKYSYDDIRKLQRELPNYFREKRTGKYIYTKLGTTINLKKGMYNGEMSIISNKDTLFYCEYLNNKPIGKYIHKMSYAGLDRYYREILPLKPKIDVDFGGGMFNAEHQKEGLWFNHEGSGSYIKGLKNGEWVDIEYSDTSSIITKTTTVYRNDTIVSKVVLDLTPREKEIEKTIPYINEQFGLYNDKNQKEGYWEEDNRRKGNYVKGLKDGEWIDYEKVGDTIITTKTIYKKGVIISTVVDKY